MIDRLQYGTTAKVFHWLVVALLLVQYLIGWLMPDVHAGPPGAPMTFHISFGIVILVLIVLRFAWRLTHPVAPESSLPPWQRLTSGAVHWALYALVLATTVTGWLFASFRGTNAFWIATAIAGIVVFFELWAIAYIRARYMDTPFLQAVFQIVLGGVIVLAVGILIGAA